MGSLLSVMLSFFRGLKQMQPQRSVAKISILCRGKRIITFKPRTFLIHSGKPISREELFAYTNGHFLVNEQWQLDRRYIKFDVDALCDVAASAGGDLSRITTVEKLEGGFSKALLMKKENGKEVVAKLACRIAGPASLTTASEVGVLEYCMYSLPDRGFSVCLYILCQWRSIQIFLFRVYFPGLRTSLILWVPNILLWRKLPEFHSFSNGER